MQWGRENSQTAEQPWGASQTRVGDGARSPHPLRKGIFRGSLGALRIGGVAGSVGVRVPLGRRGRLLGRVCL